MKEGEKAVIHGATRTSVGSFFLPDGLLPQPTEQLPLASKPAPAEARAVSSKGGSRRRFLSTGRGGRNRDTLHMPVFSNRVFQESSQCC